MERIIKIYWRCKNTENDKLKLMDEYDTKTIDDLCQQAYDNRTKADKIEIITAVIEEDEIYYVVRSFDGKHEYKNEECAINISAKQPPKKTYSFDEKIAMLTKYIKQNKTVPGKGDLIDDFDVGAFYEQTITSAEKVKRIDSIVEKYT